MNSFGFVKEESPGSGAFYWGASTDDLQSTKGIPQPMEGLQGIGPPPFLNKTYDLVDDSTTNHIVSWGKGFSSFVVWDPQLFSLNLLPRYFKHGNFSSFVRQLNTYGFRKVDPDRWEFANEGFLRGKRHLLRNIKRRKTSNSSQSQYEQDLDPCIEVGRFGLEKEIDTLRRDKQVLMEELVKLRQEQQSNRAHLNAMEQRLKGTETKQQQTINFLVRAMANPGFVQHLIRRKDKKKALEAETNNKRRGPIEHGEFGLNIGSNSDGGRNDIVVDNGTDDQSFGEVTEFDDSELDRLAMDMQRLRDDSTNLEQQGYLQRDQEERRDGGDHDGGLDQRFWADLMNDGEEIKYMDCF